MAGVKFDLITVGGGLGGSALALVMARQGANVLVLERATEFKDRVRGEAMVPWGAAQAKQLGLYDLLLESCGYELPWLEIYLGETRILRRNTVETTAHQSPFFACYHPAMQEVLLSAAQRNGAEVRRGVRVTGIEPGAPPAVVVNDGGESNTLSARLVVGADGRASMARQWAGFNVAKAPEPMLVAGVLLNTLPTPRDTAWFQFNPDIGQLAFWFPQRNGTVRAYVVYQSRQDRRLSNARHVAGFFEESIRCGVTADWFDGVQAIGPLATFEGGNTWVSHPYKDGIALIGDAAASSDPAWGEGMSLTLSDVHTLSDHLLRENDWDTAGDAYAYEHDRHFGVVHTINDWLSEFFIETGPEADRMRTRALSRIADDPTRFPDLFGLGPETPIDDSVKHRFFGND